MNCAEKACALKPELRHQFWGSIFSTFLALAPWLSSVAGCRFTRTAYSAHKRPEGCPFARPLFWGAKITRKPASYRRFPPSATTMALPNNTCPKNTHAIITRARAPTAQRKPCETALSYTKQGPDPCQNFRPALHNFAGPFWAPKLNPKTSPTFGLKNAPISRNSCLPT